MVNESSELELFSTLLWIVSSAVCPCFLTWMWIPWALKKVWTLLSVLLASRTSWGTLRWKALTWLVIGWASARPMPAMISSSDM